MTPEPQNRYATPQDSQSSSARPDISRLSQSLEPLSLRSGSSGSTAAKDEVNALGKDVIAVREAIATISKLDGLGLTKYDIPLPRCVVLGAQSTGKSSVIESISSIKTPRSTDTCTRCPLFIETAPSNDPSAKWEAKINLRAHFERTARMGTGPKYRFQGWIECSEKPHETLFASTDSTENLEELILRAQLATLNAEADPGSFLHGSITTLKASYQYAQFSPNVVSIRISGPGLPSLSFYDLPGIIGQAEDVKNQYLVRFVKDLVTEYIMDPKSLILVTHSLSDDLHNSPAGGLARDLDITQRCVGVLTKPDCLPVGASEQTLGAALDGRSFALGHGYFVVKNLAQDALNRGLDNRDARNQEREFFSSRAPWATTLLSHQSRFGTSALQSYLAEKLAAQSVTALPGIRDAIATRIESVDSELAKIPPSPTHDALHVATDCMRKYAQDVQLYIDGDYKHHLFRNNWETLQKFLATALETMRPKFVPSGSRDIGIYDSSKTLGRTLDDSILIESDDEVDDATRSPTPETPSKKRKLGSQPSTPAKALRKPGLSSNRLSSDPTKKHKGSTKKFRLDEVVASLNTISKTKIPGQLQPKVLENMMIETEAYWDKPIQEFYARLNELMRAQLRTTFDGHFNKWRDAEIFQAAWAIMDKAIKIHIDLQATTEGPEFVRDELEGPYMFHAGIWDKEKESFLERYREARFQERSKIYFNELEQSTGKVLSENEKTIRVQKDQALRSRLAHEPYTNEVDIVAKLASYYKIASHRLHDNICMRIESKFFKFLKSELYDELCSGLEIYGEKGHENCVRLLSENSARGERRRELLRQKAKLLEGQDMLQELESKYGYDTAPPLPHGIPFSRNGSVVQNGDPFSDDGQAYNDIATMNGHGLYSMNNQMGASQANPFAARVEDGMEDVKYSPRARR
ncbi:interferon-induced GTP-binding protein Mx [Lophiostoma macrostomum CBS 122681]|uniref:Interferon-induced GTP-binding protein Mx n=1 Tax=Lophiostoma macrostomum CBS 122681 TaxID=1314788 RepID=A0A6A6SSB5_9PLEO|nr:interferon-induced GTP-binding protein Mx [Lophiostoma macrostomum CBS 122681]